MPTIFTDIRVMIWAIKVDERYYSFKYKIWVNNKLTCDSIYESDHSWGDNQKGFKEHLKDGYAVSLALDKLPSLELKQLEP